MKRQTTLALALCLLTAGGAFAQTKGGGISVQMLQKMQQAQKTGANDKALFNAIASNKIDDLAKNFANQGPIDTHFSVETPKPRRMPTHWP